MHVWRTGRQGLGGITIADSFRFANTASFASAAAWCAAMVAVLLGLGGGLVPVAVTAQDEAVPALTKTAGGYEAAFFIDPLPAAAGALGRIEVAVADAATGAPVAGVTAALVIVDPLDGTESRVELEPDGERPGRFEEAGFFFASEGDWTARLILDGPLGRETMEIVIPATIRAVADEIAEGVGGPYSISIGANPVSPVAHLGSRFTTLVLTHPGGESVPETRLTYRFTKPQTGERLDLEGTRRLDQPDFFQNLITFLTPGSWRFTATVESPLGTGSIEGAIVVRENTDAGASGTALWASVMGLLIFGGVFLAWRWRNAAKRG